MLRTVEIPVILHNHKYIGIYVYCSHSVCFVQSGLEIKKQRNVMFHDPQLHLVTAVLPL